MDDNLLELPDLNDVKPSSDFINKIAPMICHICGDDAKTYHYDVPSCNGCKTFFRRSVIHRKEYKCSKSGRCEINKETRCLCRGCRWKKCIETAVIAAYKTQTEEDLNGLVFKKEPLEDDYEATATYQTQNFPHHVKPSTSQAQFFEPIIQHLLNIEDSYEFLRNSNFAPYDDNVTLNTLLEEPNLFEDYHKYQEWPKLNIKESGISPKELVQLGYKIWFYVDLVIAVNYFKCFEVFRNLPERDQYTLCKDTAAMVSYFTRDYYSYTSGADMVIFPDDSTSISTTSRDIIEAERIKYTKILLIYLQNQYGIYQGNARFVGSLSVINEYIKLKKKYADTYHTFKHYLKSGHPDPVLYFDLFNIKEHV